MPTLFYDSDADVSRLADRSIAVIGYGSQGRAHALNLRDSGLEVCVGLSPNSRSRSVAADDDVEVYDTANAVRRSEIVMLLAPDTAQASIYAESIEPNLADGATLMFAHGFNVRFN